MYKKLQGILSEQDSPSKRCLAISHSSGLARLLGLNSISIQTSNYPECNFIDLQFENNTFDFCVSDQVLEHVEGNPYKAFEESIRVVKSGGFIAHTTCFINGIHAFPGDFWRFTPDALSLMSKSNGAEVIECGGWGNKEAWAYIEMGYRSHKIPEDPQNPIYQLAMKNDPLHPIVTWVIAKVL
ncbi:MAG: class I SAM-dependent methyltransferase [Oscillatoriales cyanobacterium SM2_3_0]|nr:class I SAM-dependent methyltransferase [Oscillatoriales cyanobacterium SM2_3_0]